MIDKKELDFSKINGLIPAIIIDNTTRQVLMLGFMNEESYDKTIETKLVTFYSRSRKCLWIKGETSGSYLNLIDIKADCDKDSILIYVNPTGPTCHTGEYSCFDIPKSNPQFLDELFDIIEDRKNKLPENSYTTKLFQKGTNRIIQKVGEEAIETVIAAKNRDRVEIINEVSDLVYHIFVMLAEQNIKFNEIVQNLEQRHR
ncbi:MAG: bifunctional phosphoribosyl-AMP cyclohydrolase/phosphoribosyl-ATP diphosphatase [Ignavibacteriae bacterium HGW-Ignavibacteriae-2]|jgi:phosphoribosyl-ATP pyrophosphohydrolase/phosphoribosyl-AMP cyclohydrolase|nr:MAG: bifunctional phosphoribosyl-AMP cyclohydrolase/phosphoribosyl-ATP diphosphatase [Ignavibacteriae bacterium HGW-Ignavibacteriae-2]